jgi:hypothetical protein
MATSINDSSLETFRNDQYTITTSLSDHHIIINLMNNVSYACYEGKYENSAFSLSFDITAIFKLVNKCFAELVEPTGKSTYKVNIILSENAGTKHLVFDFDCVVEGFLTLAFKLRMVEKTGDKSLIIELNRQKQLVSELTERIDRQQQTIDGFVERMAGIERALNRTNDCPEIERIVGQQNSQLSDSSCKAKDIQSEILNEWSEDWFKAVLIIQSRLNEEEDVDFDDDDWESISSNPNLTWKIVQQNPDNPWDWYGISENPNITWDIVQQNPDYPWDWYGLSMNPNLTWDIVKQNPDKPWIWTNLLIYNPFTKDRENYIQRKMK